MQLQPAAIFTLLAIDVSRKKPTERHALARPLASRTESNRASVEGAGKDGVCDYFTIPARVEPSKSHAPPTLTILTKYTAV
jgi:hypothetical protein